nr:PREDICTED: LOW QUALITY PROTEIN: WD repeat-containing protein 63-like [Linepithema humile]
MSRNGIKYRSSWTLHDENIENVERVSLTAEAQRELGCAVGEHVFLEYPWAYVSRETVSRLANTAGSSLELHRDKIEIYGGDTFLVGYSSTQLSGCDFVICLTEDARSVITKRNADISKGIRSEVMRKIRKTGGSWKTLASETVLDETVSASVRCTRELFEVEVSFPLKSLGLNRKLCDRLSGDSSDSYVELIPYERFENIQRRCISRTIQTHLEPREIQVQTYPGYPKNAWTQYMYNDILPSEADDDELREEETESEEKRETEESKDASEVDAEEKPIEKSSLELFLEARAQEMIDAVCYNTVVNVYVDDIETLARRELEVSQQRSEITFVERYSLINLRFTTGKVIADVSWHPSLVDYVAVSYVAIPSCETSSPSSPSVEDGAAASKTESTVLLWSLADSLRPQLLLRCHQDIYCISFCPTNSDFVIGGSVSGQVVVWNIHGRIADRNIDEVEINFAIRDIVSEVSASMISDLNHLHQLPIRRIQWLPDNYRIEPSGKLTKLSSHSSYQFVTISDDGIVAIWDLLKYSITSQLKPGSGQDFDDIFRPTYRLNLRTSTDSSFTPLCLCLPPDSVFQTDDKRNQLDSMDVDDAKRLWIGMAQGQFVCCTWEGQDTETTDLEECKFLGCISAHDGPVVAILRSPHVPDILLTIGGHVFAIWKDDFLDLPLFRRKSDNIYTACCWGNRPGTFLMGTNQGDLEIWDIKRRANEPIRTQTIFRQPITVLSPQESCKHGFKLIGVGDCNSIFRIFKESTEFEDNILERMDWFEEFVWREIRRKKMFFSWQKDFLQNDPTIVAKRQARAKEERRLKLETARLKLHKEHEERLRLEAEEKERKAPKSKDTMWKLRQQERMKKILLEKKKFAPRELEEKRQPLVRLAEERNQKMTKAKNQVSLCDQHFHKIVSRKFPEFHDLAEKDKSLEQKHEIVQDEEAISALLQEFYKIRDEVRKTVAEKSYVPKFDWNTCMKEDKERLQNTKHSQKQVQS